MVLGQQTTMRLESSHGSKEQIYSALKDFGGEVQTGRQTVLHRPQRCADSPGDGPEPQHSQQAPERHQGADSRRLRGGVTGVGRGGGGRELLRGEARQGGQGQGRAGENHRVRPVQKAGARLHGDRSRLLQGHAAGHNQGAD